MRLVFGLYTRERLGGKTVARTLNNRGHRTTTGGPWSARPVARLLANRIYLGELAFRGITATSRTRRSSARRPSRSAADPGRPRQGPLQARRERYRLPAPGRCAARPRQGDDRHPTPRPPQPRLPVLHLLHPCPVRLSALQCDRLDADIVEHAVIAALASFSRDRRDLIAEAISAAHASPAPRGRAGAPSWPPPSTS